MYHLDRWLKPHHGFIPASAYIRGCMQTSRVIPMSVRACIHA